MNKIIEIEEWFLIWPDNEEEKCDSPEEAMEIIEGVAEQYNVHVSWLPNQRDTGFGLEKMAVLEGREEDIEKFLDYVDRFV